MQNVYPAMGIMKNYSFISILFACLLSVPAFSAPQSKRDASAISHLQELIQEFVGQYRLKVNMDHVYLDFNERFHRKGAKAKKTFKEQSVKMRITFLQQESRLVPLPVESIANRLDQEVIQKFCRDQKLKSKNVRIMVLDPSEDDRSPSDTETEMASAQIQDDIGLKITAKCVPRSKKVRR